MRGEDAHLPKLIVVVSGHFKIGHLWPLQNRPPNEPLTAISTAYALHYCFCSNLQALSLSR